MQFRQAYREGMALLCRPSQPMNASGSSFLGSPLSLNNDGPMRPEEVGRLNISAAAHEIGVNPETIRSWDDRIPSLHIRRDLSGRRQFDQEALQLLKVVKELQDQGRSFDTITAVLNRPSPDVMTTAPVLVRNEPRLDWLQATLIAAREAAESRERALSESLDRARSRIALLVSEVASLRGRVADLTLHGDHLAAIVANSNDRLERTELMSAVRQEEAPRAWWRFWD